MKCLEENAFKKLISLFKGDLNEKADIDLCNVIKDEKAWIEGSLPSSAYWSSICYRDDKFVAVVDGRGAAYLKKTVSMNGLKNFLTFLKK